MKHRPIAILTSAFMVLIIATPAAVQAQEETPPTDAPYQEAIEDPASTPLQQPTLEADTTTPTLPSVPSSPYTPVNPAPEPASSENLITPYMPVAQAKTVSVLRKNHRLPVALTTSLTMRSIQNSPIWSALK